MNETTAQLKKLDVSTPGRLFFRGWVIFLTAWFCTGWIYSLCLHIDLKNSKSPDSEILAQIKNIERRLNLGEDRFMLNLIPEGSLFSNTLYGFSLVNRACTLADDDPEKLTIQFRLGELIEKVKGYYRVYPFDLNNKVEPKGGVILAGHLNLLRAGYVVSGGKCIGTIDEFHKSCEKISAAILESRTGFLECYEGHTWAQDSVFAVQSLRMHDIIYGTDYSAAINKYLSSLKEHIDTQSGLMVAQVDPETGKDIEGARGSATTWGLSLLPGLDKKFALSQYQQFQKQWLVNILGCQASYEWFEGKAQPTNFHAGPVIFGLGMASSGIAIAAARANGDIATWHRLLRSLELLGVPSITPTGEKSYFLNLCLMADVVALWGKTITPWKSSQTPFQPAEESGFDSFILVIATVVLISLALLLFLFYRTIRFVKDKNTIRVGWKAQTILGLVLQVVFAALFFLTGLFNWFQLLTFMLITDYLEALAVRPAVIRQKYDELNK